MIKIKPCKGHGIAIGCGCGKPTNVKLLRHGLCRECFRDWLLNTNNGKKFLLKSISQSKKIYNKRNKEKKMLAKKHSPKDLYKTTAWLYCRKYILLYYSVNGKVQCCTSGKWYDITDRNIQCGHYYKLTEHAATAFEFVNLGPQCYRDNHYFSGKPEIMREWIKNTHGEDALEWLDKKKNEEYKIDAFELDKWKNFYKEKFNELVKIKGNPWK